MNLGRQLPSADVDASNDAASEFRRLHASGCFVMPNPFDAGSAKALEQMGFKATDSQTNFIFVNIQRPAAAFRDACREAGVMVGRDFPPYEKTHCRISIGTQAEMDRAVAVFKKVLASQSNTNQAGQ